MKSLKSLAVLSIAVVFSLALVGCGGGASTSESASSAPASPVEQLAKASGAAVHLDEANSTASVDVVVAEGESLFLMANLEKCEGAVTVDTNKDGEMFSNDSFYEGYGCSEAEVDPGTYTLQIDGAGAVGTVWALAYPAGTIDFQSMDTEQIIEKVLADVA